MDKKATLTLWGKIWRIALVVFVVIVLLLIALVYIGLKINSSLTESAKNSHVFNFVINETNSSIDGDVFINNASFGSTVDGKLVFPILTEDKFPSEFIFKGKYSGADFEFTYQFPRDYLNYSTYNFIVYQSDLDWYVKYNRAKNADAYSSASSAHWTHMPLTYKIYDSITNKNGTTSACKVPDDTRLGLKYAMDRLHTTINSISFNEVSSNEDIGIYACDDQYSLEVLAKANEVKDNKYYTLGRMLPESYHYNESLGLPPACGSDSEVHYLLLALGEPVSNDVSDVMNSMDSSCAHPRSISNQTIARLMGIYG
jgi:hypothetical protein